MSSEIILKVKTGKMKVKQNQNESQQQQQNNTELFLRQNNTELFLRREVSWELKSILTLVAWYSTDTYFSMKKRNECGKWRPAAILGA